MKILILHCFMNKDERNFLTKTVFYNFFTTYVKYRISINLEEK